MVHMLSDSGYSKPSQKNFQRSVIFSKLLMGFLLMVMYSWWKMIRSSPCAWLKMSIGEDLVYDQSNDELVGFTDILVIKRSIYDIISTFSDSIMLAFMVMRLFLYYNSHMSCFRVKILCEIFCSSPIWEAVLRLKSCGFQVCTVV